MFIKALEFCYETKGRSAVDQVWSWCAGLNTAPFYLILTLNLIELLTSHKQFVVQDLHFLL